MFSAGRMLEFEATVIRAKTIKIYVEILANKNKRIDCRRMPITYINFSLLNDSEVSIGIYNLNGERIVSLANEMYNSGHHNIVWNANAQSTGIYFVKMIAGEFITTQKLMLIK